MRTWETVRKMEEKLEAYRFLFRVKKKPLNDETFLKCKKHLQVLGLNRAFGQCPFPTECDRYLECDLAKGCNADVCSNGYSYRMS